MSANHMQRVDYWKGIIDPLNLRKKYKATFEQLANKEYKALKFKKLVGHQIYSIRHTQGLRILLADIIKDGERYLYVMCEVHKREYETHPLLSQPTVLRKHLELTGLAFQAGDVTAKSFESVEEPPLALQQESLDQENISAEYFMQRFISLDDGQQEIVTKVSYPLIIEGPAGSGKSFVLMSLLKKYITDHPDANIVYVTESPDLSACMEANWKCMPIAFEQREGSVKFLSYSKLIDLVCPNEDETKPRKRAGKTEFKAYFTDRLKELRRQAGANVVKSFSKEFYENIDKLYLECRMIGAWENEKDYIDSKKTLIQAKIEKTWLYKEYKTYVRYLRKLNCIDDAFFYADVANKIPLLVVDEAQDLTPEQLRMLKSMSNNICCCLHDQQGLTDAYGKFAFLSKLLNTKKKRLTRMPLRRSYRCPAAVGKVANVVSEICANVTGEHFVATDFSGSAAKEGAVIYYEDMDAETLTRIRKLAETPDFAIITRKKYCTDETKEKFGTQLVLTVDQIKGREYPFIMLYRMLDSRHLYRDKNSQFGEKAGLELKKLYTACTRSTRDLYIVQAGCQNQHRLTHITDRIRKACGDSKPASLTSEPLSSVSSNTIDIEQKWFNEVRKWLANGKSGMDVARSIFIKKLKRDTKDFESFLRIEFPHLIEIAASPQPENTLATPDKSVKLKSKKKPARLYQSLKAELATAESVEVFLKLVAAKSEQMIKAVFNDPERDKYLFSILPGKKITLFSALRLVNRNFVADTLVKHVHTIIPALTTEALCGSEWPESLPIEYMPPICSFLSPRLIEKYLSVPALANHFINIIDVRSLTVSCSSDHSTACGFTILCNSDAGIKLLIDIINQHTHAARLISFAMLIETHGAGNSFSFSMLENMLTLKTHGFIALNLILNHHPDLAYSLRLHHLAGISEKKKVFLLDTVQSHPVGRAFLKRLQILNPWLSRYDLSVPSSGLNADCHLAIKARYSYLQNMHEYKQNKRMQDYANELINNPSTENIANLFKDDNPFNILFNTVVNGEYVFTHLMDRLDSRKCLLIYFFAAFCKKESTIALRNALNADCMFRIDRKSKKLPPIFWLLGNEFMKADLLQDPRLLFDVSIESLMKTITVAEYLEASLPAAVSAATDQTYAEFFADPNATICAFDLLLMHPIGIQRLAKVTEFDLRHRLVTERLQYLSGHSNAGCLLACQALGSSVLTDKGYQSGVLSNGLDLNSERDYAGSCILLNLAQYGHVWLIVNLINNSIKRASATSNILIDKKAIAILFHAFTRDANHQSLTVKMMQLLLSDNDAELFITALHAIIKANQRLIRDFDQSLFNSTQLQQSSPKAELLKLLNSTKTGSLLTTIIINYISGYPDEAILNEIVSDLSSKLTDITPQELCGETWPLSAPHSEMPLIYLLSDNPAALKKLTATRQTLEMFCQRTEPRSLVIYVNDKDNELGNSTIYNLCKTEDGIQILIQLIQTYPELARLLSFAMFIEKRIIDGKVLPSIFENLASRPSGGHTALQLLITYHPELSYSVIFSHLARVVDGHKEPLLFTLKCTESGMEILKQIQPNNTSLHNVDLTESHDVLNAMCQYSQKILNGVIAKATMTHDKRAMEYLNHLLLNLTSKNISLLLNHKSALKYIFSIKVKGEYLFTHLMDNPVSRKEMMKHLVPLFKHPDLEHYINADSLYRVDRKSDKVPPIFWLLANEEILERLVSLLEHPMLRLDISTELLMKCIPVSEYKQAGLPDHFNALKHPRLSGIADEDTISSLDIIIVMERSHFLIANNAEFDFRHRLVTARLQHLSQQKYGAMVWDLLISKRLKHVRFQENLLCDGLEITQDGDVVGSAMLTRLATFSSGAMAIVCMVSGGYSFINQKLISMFMHPFTKHAKETSITVKMLADFLTHDKEDLFIRTLISFLKTTPGLFHYFDRGLFLLESCDSPARLSLLKQFKATPVGLEFIQVIKDQMLILDQRLATRQNFALFPAPPAEQPVSATASSVLSVSTTAK